MKKFTFPVAVLAAVALAACKGSDLPTSAITLIPATPELRGEVIANNLCTRCHGGDLRGRSLGSLESPSLGIAARYTIEEFDRLLGTGVARDGRTVNAAMSATRSLSRDDRRAILQYLVATMR